MPRVKRDCRVTQERCPRQTETLVQGRTCSCQNQVILVRSGTSFSQVRYLFVPFKGKRGCQTHQLKTWDISYKFRHQLHTSDIIYRFRTSVTHIRRQLHTSDTSYRIIHQLLTSDLSYRHQASDTDIRHQLDIRHHWITRIGTTIT